MGLARIILSQETGTGPLPWVRISLSVCSCLSVTISSLYASQSGICFCMSVRQSVSQTNVSVCLPAHAFRLLSYCLFYVLPLIVSLSVCLQSVSLSANLSVCLSLCQSVSQSVYLSVNQSVCLSFSQSICMPANKLVCLTF